MLAPYAVHTPFGAPEELTARCRERLGGTAEGGTPDDPDFRTAGNVTDKTAQNNPSYAAMVEKTDESVGRVLDALDEFGLAANTLVILTSDHGGLSNRARGSRRQLATTNAPCRHGKGWLYDGGPRVPLVVRWPGVVAPGSRSARRVLGVDHDPTILAACGLPPAPEDAVDGADYLPALRGRGMPARGPMFFHSPRARPQSTGDENTSALIDGRWKVVRHHADNRHELSDLEADPGEERDLAAEEPEKLARIRAQLAEAAREAGARAGGRNPFDKKNQP